MNQIEMLSLNDLVSANHRYRKYCELWDFKNTYNKYLKPLESNNNYQGYGVLRLFKCLLLQFMEDLSDRELELFIQENNAGKWFCEFKLSECTPDHSVFCKFRKKIGTNKLSKIFSSLRDQLKEQGYINEIFTFVDSSHLISKSNLWKKRDKAIQKKYEKLNNDVLPKVSRDKQAKIGCKGKHKYWYGYKKHESVDMQSGLINKVAVTPANITDDAGFKHVCPNQGAAYADKGYCSSKAQKIALAKSCHLAAIKKNNMKDKNHKLDKWYSKIRAPYERVFSKQNKRVRYIGIAKNQFSEFMNAICFNLKRLVVLKPPNLILS